MNTKIKVSLIFLLLVSVALPIFILSSGQREELSDNTDESNAEQSVPEDQSEIEEEENYKQVKLEMRNFLDGGTLLPNGTRTPYYRPIYAGERNVYNVTVYVRMIQDDDGLVYTNESLANREIFEKNYYVTDYVKAGEYCYWECTWITEISSVLILDVEAYGWILNEE